MLFKFSLSILCYCFLFATQVNANVPALYVFGDSLADVGNNNYLPFSFLKADFPHNGVDFPSQNATGRFSNGKNPADFLAEKLGLVSPPPFLSILMNSNITEVFMKGVSFASAGAGVLDSTREGQCLKLSKQIDSYSELYMNLLEKIGNAETQYHLSKSIFLLVVGSNDILDYVRKPYNQSGIISSYKLLDVMISSLNKHLKKLHDFGARKIAFVGTGPIGCCPAQRRYTSLNACNSKTNSISVQYSNKVASLLHEMKLELKSLSFSFFNSSSKFQEYIDKPTDYGFSEVKSACCGIGDLNAEIGCIPISRLCPSRRSFVFWDLYHPTEATAQLLIDTLYDGSLEYVYPINELLGNPIPPSPTAEPTLDVRAAAPYAMIKNYTRITGQPKGYIVFSNKDSVDKALSMSWSSLFSWVLTVLRKADMPPNFLVPSAPSTKLLKQQPLKQFEIPWKPPSMSAPKKFYPSPHPEWIRDDSLASGNRENSVSAAAKNVKISKTPASTGHKMIK